ncbi:hypothetical protein SAMN05444161_0289 [Rhizobiales bacterium GAS191]|nr:hypothetical protein SAMN05444161_0289 [Rhizobiales bacterium GAS191]
MDIKAIRLGFRGGEEAFATGAGERQIWGGGSLNSAMENDSLLDGRMRSRALSFVMAGLGPAIHVLLSWAAGRQIDIMSNRREGTPCIGATNDLIRRDWGDYCATLVEGRHGWPGQARP